MKLKYVRGVKFQSLVGNIDSIGTTMNNWLKNVNPESFEIAYGAPNSPSTTVIIMAYVEAKKDE